MPDESALLEELRSMVRRYKTELDKAQGELKKERVQSRAKLALLQKQLEAATAEAVDQNASPNVSVERRQLYDLRRQLDEYKKKERAWNQRQEILHNGDLNSSGTSSLSDRENSEDIKRKCGELENVVTELHHQLTETLHSTSLGSARNGECNGNCSLRSNQELMIRIGDLEAELTVYRNRDEALRKDNYELVQKLDALEAERIALFDEKEKLTKKITSLSRDVRLLEQRAKTQSVEHERQCQLLRVEATKHNDTLTNLRRKYINLDTRYRKLVREKRERLTAAREELGPSLESINSEYDLMRDRYSTMEAEMHGLRMQVANLSSVLESTRDSKFTLEQKNCELQVNLAALRGVISPEKKPETVSACVGCNLEVDMVRILEDRVADLEIELDKAKSTVNGYAIDDFKDIPSDFFCRVQEVADRFNLCLNVDNYESVLEVIQLLESLYSELKNDNVMTSNAYLESIRATKKEFHTLKNLYLTNITQFKNDLGLLVLNIVTSVNNLCSATAKCAEQHYSSNCDIGDVASKISNVISAIDTAYSKFCEDACCQIDRHDLHLLKITSDTNRFSELLMELQDFKTRCTDVLNKCGLASLDDIYDAVMKNETLAKDLHFTKQQLVEIQNQLEEKCNEHSKLTVSSEQLGVKLKDSDDQVVVLSQELRLAKDRVVALEQEICSLQAQHGDAAILLAEKEQLTLSLCVSNEQVVLLKKEVDLLNNQLTRFQNEAADLVSTNDELSTFKNYSAKLKTDCETLQNELVALREEVNILKNRNDDVNYQINLVQKEKDQLCVEAKELMSRLEKMNLCNTALGEQLLSKDEEIKNLQLSKCTLEQERAAEIERSNMLFEELGGANKQITDLQKRLHSIQQELEQCKQVLFATGIAAVNELPSVMSSLANSVDMYKTKLSEAERILQQNKQEETRKNFTLASLTKAVRELRHDHNGILNQFNQVQDAFSVFVQDISHNVQMLNSCIESAAGLQLQQDSLQESLSYSQLDSSDLQDKLDRLTAEFENVSSERDKLVGKNIAVEEDLRICKRDLELQKDEHDKMFKHLKQQNALLNRLKEKCSKADSDIAKVFEIAQVTDLESCVSRWQCLQSEKREVEDKLNEVRHEVDSLTRKNSLVLEANTVLDKYNNRFSSFIDLHNFLCSELENATSRCCRLQLELRTNEKKILYLEDEKKRLEEDKKRLENEHKTLLERCEHSLSQTAVVDADNRRNLDLVAKLTEELSNMKSSCLEQTEKLRIISDERDRYKKMSEELKAQLHNDMQHARRLESKVAALEKSLADAVSQVERVCKENENLRIKIDNIGNLDLTETISLRDKISRLESVEHSLEFQVKELKSQIVKKDTDIVALKNKCSDLSGTINNLRKEFDLLMADVSTFLQLSKCSSLEDASSKYTFYCNSLLTFHGYVRSLKQEFDALRHYVGHIFDTQKLFDGNVDNLEIVTVCAKLFQTYNENKRLATEKLDKRVKYLEDKLEIAEQEHNNMSTSLATLEDQLERQRIDLQKANADLITIRNEKDELELLCNEFTFKAQNLQCESSAQTNRDAFVVSRMNGVIRNLKSEHKRLKTEFIELQNAFERSLSGVHEAFSVISRSECRQCKETTKMITESQMQVKLLQDSLETKTSEMIQLQEFISILRSSEQKLSKQYGQVDALLNDKDLELKRCFKKSDLLATELELKQAEIDTLRTQVAAAEALEQACKTSDTECASEERDHLHVLCKDLTNQQKLLVRERRDLESELVSMKEQEQIFLETIHEKHRSLETAQGTVVTLTMELQAVAERERIMQSEMALLRKQLTVTEENMSNLREAINDLKTKKTPETKTWPADVVIPVTGDTSLYNSDTVEAPYVYDRNGVRQMGSPRHSSPKRTEPNLQERALTRIPPARYLITRQFQGQLQALSRWFFGSGPQREASNI